MKIWLNGALLENGTINASSAGITLGWGVFTTLGIRNGAPRFLERHFARLKRDADAAQLDFAFDFETISHAVGAVIGANAVQNGSARLTLTQRGDGHWNKRDGADFSIFALENPPSNERLRVQLSTYRIEARRPLAGAKITSYLPYLWAWREAKQSGFDEAILRESSDFLSEGARSTLLWLQNGELFTPCLQTGCLRGIGRDLCLQWARERLIPINEGRFLASQAENAEAVWLVSAAQGPRLISSWHDENGALQREFGAMNETGRDLLAWWKEFER